MPVKRMHYETKLRSNQDFSREIKLSVATCRYTRRGGARKYKEARN